MTEFILTEKISSYLIESGYSVHLEVPNMGHSVDIVAQKNDSLSFIEVKLNNWRRAISQCKNHSLVADFIFIAIASKKVSPSLLEQASKHGFGIIHYNKVADDCIIYLEALQNEKIWPPQRGVLHNKLRT